jgi:hypothetical protein
MVQTTSQAADRTFDDEGKIQELEDNYQLFTTDLRLSYGILSGWEVFGGMPYLTGTVLETKGGGIGDLYLGTRLDLVSAPSFDLVLGIRTSFPTGDASYHYEDLGAGPVLQNFRTGDPGINYYPALDLRWNVGAWSFRLAGEGVFTSPGEVDLNMLGGVAEKVDLDPGDGWRASSGIYWQVTDRWVLGLLSQYETITATRLENDDLDDEHSSFRVSPRIIFQVPRLCDLEAGVDYIASGRNTPLGWPITINLVTRF